MTPATAGPDAMPILQSERAARARIRSVADGGKHRERHVHDHGGVVGARLRDARDHHVGVADGLDLLEAVSLGERVEPAEDLVEHGHDPRRRLAGRERREVDDVGEQDRDLLAVVGDDAFAALEAIGDRARQDVEEQGVGLRLRAHALAVDEHHEARARARPGR